MYRQLSKTDMTIVEFPPAVNANSISKWKRRPAIVFFLACALAYGSPPARGDEFTFYHENVLGTSLELAVAADNIDAARQAETRVLAEVDRLSLIYSGYDDRSEFSRWQHARSGMPKRISGELFDVLAACDRWGKWSGWAFDPRVETLTKLWARCAELGRLPSDSELTNAKAQMQRRPWKLDPAARTAERSSDCPLSLNGIAKGHIVELACELALDPTRGVRGAMLNVGGDLCVRGEITPTIGVAAPWADSESSEPVGVIAVTDRSVATSGNSQRGFRIQGRWYSHIFDPRTGLPVDHVSSATVIATRGIEADVLAKVFNVLSPAESIRLANSLEGVACLIVTREGESVKSNNWHHYERAKPVLAAPTAAPEPQSARQIDKPRHPAAAVPGSAWSRDFELVVNYEINRPDDAGGRYRRPYVAIWIENKNGFQVRTLVLWVSFGGAGPFQWLPDLKRWHKSDRDRKAIEKKEILFTVARPTRQPGKYKIIWDGKDNNGKQLGGGAYTVCIDAAREHGTYQSIRKQVTLEDKPFTEQLEGNVEIRSASIEYRRKAATK